MYNFLGDVDNDGRITFLDAVGVLQVSAGMISGPYVKWKADTNGDGVVTADDMNLILQHLSGEKILDGVIK
jgi:hypothetical protein